VVRLDRGTRLYEAGTKIECVYFPNDCVISLVAVLRDGRIAETGTIGREGFTGSEAIISQDDTSTSRCLAQVSGTAAKVPVKILAAMASDRAPVRELLMAYVNALFAQVLQSVACNASHSVEERCARWMLMTHDRAGTDTFDLTQEFLAEMLGVRRASVNLVSRTFQDTGIIRYSRGRITVLDRAGLEAAACECYGVIERRFARLMPQVVRD
jgi:CRP-like cAMP-binding protein